VGPSLGGNGGGARLRSANFRAAARRLVRRLGDRRPHPRSRSPCVSIFKREAHDERSRLAARAITTGGQSRPAGGQRPRAQVGKPSPYPGRRRNGKLRFDREPIRPDMKRGDPFRFRVRRARLPRVAGCRRFVTAFRRETATYTCRRPQWIASTWAKHGGACGNSAPARSWSRRLSLASRRTCCSRSRSNVPSPRSPR